VKLYITTKVYKGILKSIYGDPIGTWCVDYVTSFDGLFEPVWQETNPFEPPVILGDHFNEDISSWNTSSVTSMMGTFGFQVNFNQDLSSWDVSKVTSMEAMFIEASSFNKNLCAWGPKMGNVLYSDSMFDDTSCPNQNNLLSDGNLTNNLCHECI
jgi:surface protein